MQLLFSVPLLALLPAHLLLPESARWLLANGRAEEASSIVRRIAETNGRSLAPDWSLVPPAPSQVRIFWLIELKTKQLLQATGARPPPSFLQLFTHPNLRRKTLICYYLWFSTALIYYGLTLNSNTLGTELFTTFSIGKLLEFPSITLVIFLLLRAGRRVTLLGFYTLGGLALLLTTIVCGVWPVLGPPVIVPH